jgi:hypothetical protein
VTAALISITVVAVVAVVAVVVLAAWASRFVKHPEQTAGHDEVPADTTSDRFYRTADRPAGPDAEDPPAPV